MKARMLGGCGDYHLGGLSTERLNILVTSLSRKVPLLLALRDAAGGATVWGADSDPECVGRYFADRFWEMPPLTKPGVDAALLELCEREQIGLVIPTRDGELELFAGLRDELADRGTYVPIGSLDAVQVCLDKLRFAEHCERAGLPTPPTATSVEDAGAEALVVKERYGAGSAQLGIGLDRDAARAHGERLGQPVFQPVVDGVEHSVDVYVNREGQVVEAAPRTRIKVHEGESTVTETVEHPALAAVAIALAESLDLRGHLVIQGFTQGDEVVLLECNPRVGGASTLGFRAGVDTPAWAIREARGEAVAPQVGGYRRGLRMVRYPADRFIDP
jgi:carbamoyl-phosphate synthase large subunit